MNFDSISIDIDDLSIVHPQFLIQNDVLGCLAVDIINQLKINPCQWIHLTLIDLTIDIIDCLVTRH